MDVNPRRSGDGVQEEASSNENHEGEGISERMRVPLVSPRKLTATAMARVDIVFSNNSLIDFSSGSNGHMR